jgi:protein-disulfide isomerase
VGAGCLLALCTAAAMLAGIFHFTHLCGNQVVSPISDIVSVETNARPHVDGNSMGDPNAPIQMVEYGDYQCPFCERFYTEPEPLLVEYFIEPGDVHFTYRSAGNTESQDAALAAYCAADENKFSEMHDALFANNRDVENQGAFSSRRLLAIAERIGLDRTTFQDCYDGGKYADQVQQDFDDAMESGIQGTPFFVLTHQVNSETQTEYIGGAQPFDAFQQTIETILQVRINSHTLPVLREKFLRKGECEVIMTSNNSFS